MALMMYSSLSSRYSSTQAYLGSVKMCCSCKGQQPKQLFKIVDGEEICHECQEELLQLNDEEIAHV